MRCVSEPKSQAPRAAESWLVKHPAEWRAVGIVLTYLGLLGSMYFVPACRNVFFFGAALYFSFLNTIIIHNHLHQGMFKSRRLNMIWRCVLSFGSLYPATANVPSHNLVHHHFDDDGQPDWAAPENVSFKWNLLNLIHFPNVAGPNTFAGTQRWMAAGGRKSERRQYILEQVVAFGLTGLLLVNDFWTGLFFVVLPQFYGARCILRINLIQHDACDVKSEWNHSRNFVGRFFNWIMCNNGYHTIHHNRAWMHWSELDRAHEREVVPRQDPSLDEPSMVGYLLRTYILNVKRPAPRDVAAAERAFAERGDLGLEDRRTRRRKAEVAAEAAQAGA
jgi:fatty acid desaturase